MLVVVREVLDLIHRILMSHRAERGEGGATHLGVRISQMSASEIGCSFPIELGDVFDRHGSNRRALMAHERRELLARHVGCVDHQALQRKNNLRWRAPANCLSQHVLDGRIDLQIRLLTQVGLSPHQTAPESIDVGPPNKRDDGDPNDAKQQRNETDLGNAA